MITGVMRQTLMSVSFNQLLGLYSFLGEMDFIEPHYNWIYIDISS
jgi:hypothetical protein